MRKWVGSGSGDDRGSDDLDGGVGDECEAFLRGEYVRWLLTRGEQVPAWAWFNRAAHGSFDAIAAHVADTALVGRGCCHPHAAVLVEGLLLAHVPPDDLAEVQRRIVVPIELDVQRARLAPSVVADQAVRTLGLPCPPPGRPGPGREGRA